MRLSTPRASSIAILTPKRSFCGTDLSTIYALLVYIAVYGMHRNFCKCKLALMCFLTNNKIYLVIT